MSIAALFLAVLMQVGPNPSASPSLGLPEEEVARRARQKAATAQQAPAGPAPAAAPSRLGECLAGANEDPDAALDYAQAWREGSTSNLDLAQSAHCLGLALVGLDRMTEARDVFAKAAEDTPDTHPAYAARLFAMAGNAALAAGDNAGALAQFEAAVGVATTVGAAAPLAGFETDRARALVALGREEEAVAALAKARAEDPTSPRAWLLAATLSRRLERLGEAQKQIEQAALLAPTDPAVGLEAGVIAAMGGRDAEARASFESVVVVAPQSAEAARARTYLEQLAK